MVKIFTSEVTRNMLHSDFLKSVASQILTVTCITNMALKTILEELLIQQREKLFLFQPQILVGAMLLYSTFTFLKSRHLPSKVTPFFYMKPMPFTPTGIKPWFWDENFPKTKLSTLLKTMMKEANISGNFTNHSLHVTGTTMLFDSGTPEAIIQKRTGHRSLSAL